VNNDSNAEKLKLGLTKGIISLAFGIVSAIVTITCGIWIPMLLAAPPLALVGLIFGAIGSSSIGKGKYLAVAGIVICSLALVASLYLLFTGGFYYIFTY
jgi:hypothetical protein